MINNKDKIILGGIILIIVLVGSLIPVSAEIIEFGPFYPGDTISITQTCADSTYSNITKLIAPNSTAVLDGQYAMTKLGDNYNYSYIVTSAGNWLVYGECDEDGDKTLWQYTIPVGEMELPATILYISFLVGLIILLGFSVSKITSANNYGWVIGYASLSYFCFLSTLFITYKLSLNFLTFIPYISTILYIIFLITLVMMLPLFLVCIIYLMSKVSTERDIEKMVDMGYTREEAVKSKKRRR